MRQSEDERFDILFYGPFGNNIPPERSGGAEIGCRRSVDLLKKHGFSVHEVEKPTRYYGVNRFLQDFIKVVFHITKILRGNRGILFYMVGFYDRQLFFEFLLYLIAKRYDCHFLYEPKNGMLVKKYQCGGWIYRWMSNVIFRGADMILCQGMEYQEFLREQGYHHTVYHPNYVSNDVLSLVHRETEASKTIFIYFGRVAPSKNVDLCVEIFREFHEKREDSELYIIGGAKEEYRDALWKQFVSGGIETAVHMTGPLAFAEIAGYLNRADYFLFPSGEEFEGHSNSLTEAMAFGVVPVASSAGFNRTVIGDGTLIVESKEAAGYLNVIMEIEEYGRWGYYSEYVSGRVKDCYSEDVVKERYLDTVGRFVLARRVYADHR